MKLVPTKFEVHTTIFGCTSQIKTKKPGMKNLTSGGTLSAGKCSGVGAKVDIKREMVDIDYAWFCELVLRY